MSYRDFLRAVTPYNHGELPTNEEIDAYLENHGSQLKDILAVADADGDKTISFTEFFFFQTLIHVDTKIIDKEFEQKGGKVTKEEFSDILMKHR